MSPTVNALYADSPYSAARSAIASLTSAVVVISSWATVPRMLLINVVAVMPALFNAVAASSYSVVNASGRLPFAT